MTSVPEELEEEDTTKFYNGYMARVVALQEMTKEFNRELAEIENSDGDAQSKKRKKKAAAAASSPLSELSDPLLAIEGGSAAAAGIDTTSGGAMSLVE